MNAMLSNGVLPIINENDTVSVEELMFTDNDELSGLVARMMNADVLVILSNVDGVYSGSPDSPDSRLIPEISQSDDFTQCIDSVKSAQGRGGMATKMKTAMEVARDGIPVIIANGKKHDILTDVILNPETCRFTKFLP